jgi:hypothetical protein
MEKKANKEDAIDSDNEADMEIKEALAAAAEAKGYGNDKKELQVAFWREYWIFE